MSATYKAIELSGPEKFSGVTKPLRQWPHPSGTPHTLRHHFGGSTIAMNQTNVSLFIESMPYGVVGTSGIGNYYGKCGYDSLTHAKSILISPPDVAIEHLFPPYTKEKVQALSQWFEY